MVQLSVALTSVAIFAFSAALPHIVYPPVEKAQDQSHSCGALDGGKHPGNGGGNANIDAKPPKAVYFMTNEAANSIVAMRVTANGSLSQGSVTSTGGAGMNGIDSSTGGPAAPDALFSQGAVKVAGNVSVLECMEIFPFTHLSRCNGWIRHCADTSHRPCSPSIQAPIQSPCSSLMPSTQRS